MKYFLLILVALGIGVATIPLWGSCSLKYRFCDTWCGVRYFDSDSKTLTCRARCITSQANCLARDGAAAVNELLDDVQGRNR